MKRHSFPNPVDIARFAWALGQCYPHGATGGGTPYGSAVSTMQTVVSVLSGLFEECGSLIRLKLDYEIKGGKALVHGMVVCDGADTEVIPITLRANLVLIRERPVCMTHEKTATMILDAVLAEIEAITEAETVAA